MKRIYPRRIEDKFFLSQLLEKYLGALADSPMQVRLKALSYDSGIPESIFQRLMRLQYEPEDAANINAEDFHIVFSNIMFRFPTVKIWEETDGTIYFEM
jgi:hypothetical protein